MNNLQSAKQTILEILEKENEFTLLNVVKNGEMDNSIKEHLQYADSFEIAYCIIEHGGI